MVKALDVEKLFDRYMEQERYDMVEALYLITKIGFSYAIDTIRARYGSSEAISGVSEDLAGLGLKVGPSGIEPSVTEDSRERIADIVWFKYKDTYLKILMNRVQGEVKRLGLKTKKMLWLITYRLGIQEYYYIDDLRKYFQILYGEKLSKIDMGFIIDELRKIHVVEYISSNVLYLTPYAENIIKAIRDLLPIVEIRISEHKT